MVYPCGAAANAGIAAVVSAIAMAIIMTIIFFINFFIVLFPFFLSLKEGYIIVCNNNMTTKKKNKKKRLLTQSLGAYLDAVAARSSALELRAKRIAVLPPSMMA